MSAPVLIRGLRLRGTARDYDVRFDGDGGLLPLSVIAGPMRTGKTTILHLIDWCLGASRHPEHDQLQRVTAALLEVDLAGHTHVIARHMFGDSGFVQLHSSGLTTLAEPHEVRKMPVGPASEEDSLSAYLVDLCGLAGSAIRRRPSAADSDTFALSYRNLSWLAYLPSDRLEGHRLLHEDRPQDRMHQHRQTLDIAFEVADETLAQATARFNAARLRITNLDDEIRAVERFLGDEIPTSGDLADRQEALRSEATELRAQRDEIDASVRAADSYPAQLRERVFEASASARDATVRLRDRRTLIERLAPLRHQYAEELKKLNFVQEARQVLDPLPVVRCPVCSSDLLAPGVSAGTCELCGQSPPAAAADAEVDLSSEVRSVEARLKELAAYINEIDAEIGDLEAQVIAASAAEVTAQQQLDVAARDAVTPYLAERDQLTSSLADVRGALAALEAVKDQRNALDRLLVEREDARTTAEQRKAEVERLQENQLTRDSVLELLGGRFYALLAEVGFPDLEAAGVDDNYAPTINGRAYTAETSSGAQVLISVCWQLAVFELLLDDGHPHPGYLLIDSIQKGLAQQPVAGADDRYSDPAIVERLYSHIENFVEPRRGEAQVILVDNSPPGSHRDAIAVEFTRDPANPPYGLIDDAFPVDQEEDVPEREGDGEQN